MSCCWEGERRWEGTEGIARLPRILYNNENVLVEAGGNPAPHLRYELESMLGVELFPRIQRVESYRPGPWSVSFLRQGPSEGMGLK